MRRHLDPMTKEPRGPLWLGLLLILGGMFGLLLLFTGCGSAAVSAGPAVGGSSGLGYERPAAGIEAVAERPGLRAEMALSTATKPGEERGGGAEARLLAGQRHGRLGLWAGLRGYAQRADEETRTGWNPLLAVSWQVDRSSRWWLVWDAPDSSWRATQAIRLVLEVGRDLVFAPGCDYVRFGGWGKRSEHGWACTAAVRWRMRP
ncbi:MAG: hypothetical protein QM311_05340 [Acidobacteriota bacterium]|nr:hypothetical protein [Acidobacteriota bacterium]